MPPHTTLECHIVLVTMTHSAMTVPVLRAMLIGVIAQHVNVYMTSCILWRNLHFLVHRNRKLVAVVMLHTWNSLIIVTVQCHMARYLVMSIVESKTTTETCVKYLCCYMWLCISRAICSRACLVMCRVMHSSSNTDSQ